MTQRLQKYTDHMPNETSRECNFLSHPKPRRCLNGPTNRGGHRLRSHGLRVRSRRGQTVGTPHSQHHRRASSVWGHGVRTALVVLTICCQNQNQTKITYGKPTVKYKPEPVKSQNNHTAHSRWNNGKSPPCGYLRDPARRSNHHQDGVPTSGWC